MSFELPYHPPRGSKWAWSPKALNYSPWVCDLLKQREPTLRHDLWPLSCMLYVNLIDGLYCWRVSTNSFDHIALHQIGQAKSAIQAMRMAERVGERFLRRQIPKWVRTALQHGWRTPGVRST